MTYHWHHELRSQRGLPKFSEYPDLTIFASNIVSIMRLLFFLNHFSIFFSQNFACFTKLIGQIFRHSISSKGSIHSSLRIFLNSVHSNLSNLINSFWAPSKILLNFLEPYGIFRAWFIKRMILPKSISKWIHVTTYAIPFNLCRLHGRLRRGATWKWFQTAWTTLTRSTIHDTMILFAQINRTLKCALCSLLFRVPTM